MIVVTVTADRRQAGQITNILQKELKLQLGLTVQVKDKFHPSFPTDVLIEERIR